jgi:hypothetical protein
MTNEEKCQCAERELKFRERVYPRLIDQGKMTTGKATWELNLMKAIANDYRRLAEKDRLI